MNEGPKIVLALLLGAGTLQPSLRAIASEEETRPAKESASPAAVLKHVATPAPDVPFREFEDKAERQLLDLANQSRAEAGASPLTFDSGLCQAARIHAQAMLEARQLSHRFEGELSLPQRLAAKTHLQLDQEGENVAIDYSAESGHQHLMLSPPHRANLLNPVYNVVGLAVVRSGERLYIVEDFGHAIPYYSVAEIKDLIATAVNRLRRQANLPRLQPADLPTADDASCAMARSDHLDTPYVHQLAARYTLLTFTSLQPETLPAAATHAINGPNLHTALIGVCYSRTDTYPTGVYWVVLALD